MMNSQGKTSRLGVFMLLLLIAEAVLILLSWILSAMRVDGVRSLLSGDAGKDKALLDLCLDVIYHPNMKAFGLQQLVLLYINWKNHSNDNLGMTVRSFQGTPFN